MCSEVGLYPFFYHDFQFVNYYSRWCVDKKRGFVSFDETPKFVVCTRHLVLQMLFVGS